MTTGRRAEAEEEAVDLIGRLQLPRDASSLRIVAVSDLDLPCASALAEYALTNASISGGQVDLLIACGPFCRNDDLAQYLTRGRRPTIRTPELTAALEGIMTGALSQLESIVCRVCFCPAGPQDPETTLVGPADGEEGPLRLTPNSRNIHGEWLPLAPALGCGGLTVNAHENFEQFSPELSRQVQEILALAPRPSDEVSFCSDVSQAILVSTNIDFETTRVMDYSAVLGPQVCLNIIGGTARILDCAPGARIVSPGSLRRNGDFCWIDLGLVEENGAYRWQVQHVEFDNIQRA